MKSLLIFAAIVAGTLMPASAQASIENFNFSFSNATGVQPGTVQGSVRIDTEKSAATSLYLTSIPASFNYKYGSDFDFFSASNRQVFNTFVVENGNVTFARFGSALDINGPNEYQLGLNSFFGQNTLYHPDPNTAAGYVNTENFQGLNGISFTAVSAVPLPASFPMFGVSLLALGMVGRSMKRKKVATAA